jgi:hypothetical protein
MNALIFVLAFFSPSAFADMPSTHGMLLFGSEHVYISHLPMFHSAHDYQAIAEIALPPAGLAALKKAQAAHPLDTLFTLVPEAFSLPEMFAHPKPFHADLFHGHFERGGDVIAEGITVEIKKVLFFRKFVPGEAKVHTSYLLFGTPTEAFVAHYIVAKPDFDQVIAVTTDAIAGEVEKLDAPYPLIPTAPFTLGGHQGVIGREIYRESGDLAH